MSPPIRIQILSNCFLYFSNPGESIKAPKVNRFRQKFYEREIWSAKGNILFYNINRITHEMPSSDTKNKHDNYTRIFLSHLPILESNERFSRKVNLKTNRLISFAQWNRVRSSKFAMQVYYQKF